jgi:hypothetical protein
MMTAFTGVACNLERRNFPSSCQHRDLDALSGTEEFFPIHINIAISMPCSGRRDFANWHGETDLEALSCTTALEFLQDPGKEASKQMLVSVTLAKS